MRLDKSYICSPDLLSSLGLHMDVCWRGVVARAMNGTPRRKCIYIHIYTHILAFAEISLITCDQTINKYDVCLLFFAVKFLGRKKLRVCVHVLEYRIKWMNAPHPEALFTWI